jgi:adenylate kinase
MGNYKVSARDMALSKWIRDRLHYKKHQDLKHSPLNPKTTVHLADMENESDVWSFIQKHKLLNNAWIEKSGLGNLYRFVCNKGIFFRSPITRRAKNYWCPGLNAGLPLVAKRDPVHEATFMIHDLNHFVLPDLIFTGKHSSTNKSVYIAFRMISEATTMVLADILFVDTLIRDTSLGLADYDWSARRIYPLALAACGCQKGQIPFYDS